MEPINQTSNTIRWGIIGCGNVTELKSGPAYQKVAGFELRAVMRRDAQKCADYAQRHQVPKSYTDAQALINDPEIDAIYIATPPDSHKLYGLMVAQAGKPCCIEKPLAPTYQDCLEIHEAFEQKNIPLFVAYYRRSLPRFEQIKKWIDDEEIGTIRHLNWYLSKTTSPTDLSDDYNWRTDAQIAQGGYFDDLASHGIDLFEHLLGDIQQASGHSINQQGLYTAKDAIVASWVHQSGVTGTGSWNFGTATREDEVQIIGSKGKIEFSVFEEKPILLTNQKGTTEQFINHPEHVQFYHVQNIREHLNGNKTHPSTGKSGVHTSWVLDKILGKI